MDPTLTQTTPQLTEATSPQPAPIEVDATPAKHGWKIILPILLMLGVASSAFVYYALNERSEFKALVTRQSSALGRLDGTYIALLNQARDNATDFKNTDGSASLLKALVIEKYGGKTPSATFLALQRPATQVPSQPSEESRVLGLEDNPIVKKLRQFGIVYQRGLDSAREINGQNKQIKEKSKSLPATVLFPDTSRLTTKTEVMVKENEAIFNYLLETNNSGIKLMASLGDLQTALNTALFATTDAGYEQGLKTSDRHIKSFDEEVSKLASAELTELPEYLRLIHTRSVATLGQVGAVFQDLIGALRTKDTAKILSAANSANSFDTFGSVDQAKEIEFWQSESSRQGILDLRGGWDKVATSL